MNKTYQVVTRKKILSDDNELEVIIKTTGNLWETLHFGNKQEWINFYTKIRNIHKEVLKVCKEEGVK